jgi:hypothetical protein
MIFPFLSENDAAFPTAHGAGRDRSRRARERVVLAAAASSMKQRLQRFAHQADVARIRAAADTPDIQRQPSAQGQGKRRAEM